MKKFYKNLVALTLFNTIALIGFSQYNNAFRFKITGNGYSDETIIRLLDEASPNFDGLYDGWKLFSPNPNVPSIYTQIAPAQELSINALPEFTEDVSVTIYTKIPVSGTYSINVEEIFALTPNYKISLTDISSNTHYRLLGDTALIFTLNAQQNVPTFTFNISTNAITSTTDETCYDLNDGVLTVNNAGNSDWNIKILDSDNNTIINTTSSLGSKNFNNLGAGNYSSTINSKGIVDDFNFTIDPGIDLTANFNLNNDTTYISEGGLINITNTSLNAQIYTWNFDDGGTSSNVNPLYAYNTVGDYQITLSASNTNCMKQDTKLLTVLSSPNIIASINDIKNKEIKLMNFGKGNYQLYTTNSHSKEINIYDIKGKLIYEDAYSESNYLFSLASISHGIYTLIVTDANGVLFREKMAWSGASVRN